jgi:tetratricopeptide (TPR) repeat protein
MYRKELLPGVALIVGLLGWTANNAVGQERWLDVKFNYTFNPVEMVVSRVLDKFLIDPVQELLGWKESQEQLEQRLLQVIQTSNAALKSEQAEKLRELREEIRNCASRDDLKKLAAKFRSDLKEVNQRLDSAEEDLEWLKVKDEDRDKRTKNRDDPKHFLARGERYLAYNEYFKALASARIASRLDDRLAEPYLLQGQVYTAKGATNMALVCFDQAIRLDAKNALAYRCRGAGDLQEQNYAEAVAELTKAIQLDPNQGADTYLQRAEANSGTRSYDRAAADATEAIRLGARNARAYCVRGTAYYFLKDCPRAIADGSEAIRLDPKSPQAYCVRAMGYNDWTDDVRKRGIKEYFALVKQRDLAFEDCAEALRLDPKCPQAHYLQGVAGTNRTDFDMTASYAEAVRLDPKYAKAYYNSDYAAAFQHKGNVESGQGNYDRAIFYFNKAIEIDATQGDIYYDRGYSYLQKGDNDSALRDFKEALRRGTGHTDLCNQFIDRLSK